MRSTQSRWPAPTAPGPFFSPDGEWVAFYAGGKLKKVAVRGGTPVTLCDAPQYLGGSWGDNGQIVISGRTRGLMLVSAEGGDTRTVDNAGRRAGEIDHHAPHWLPGGRALFLTLHAGPEIFRVAVRSLDTGEQRTLIEDGFEARYTNSGHIVYGRANTLLAAPFDLERLTITGPSVPVVENALTVNDSGIAVFSVASDGTLIHQPATAVGGRTLTWVDRAKPNRCPLRHKRMISPRSRLTAAGSPFKSPKAHEPTSFVYQLGTRLSPARDSTAPSPDRYGRPTASG